ncbi:MAG: PAS domain S-box protein [Desulfobacteraceae bacterium]|nr:PAS domain S-box protein [Desulfobacteraceae bacterium]
MNSDTREKQDRSLRVLLVEDDPEDMTIFRRYAQCSTNYCFQVDHADMPDMMESFLSQHDYDLVFLDQRLGGAITGLELLKQIKPAWPDIPVIVLTGTGDQKIAVEMMKSGATDYLTKDTFNSEILDRAVRYALEQHRSNLRRKQAEEGLRESESRFREMAELLPTIIWEMDTGLRITYTNNLGLQTLGYTQEEFDAGINGIDLLHPDDKEAVTRHIEQVVKGVDIGPMEYRMLRKDGSEIFTLVHAALIHKGGRITGFRVSVSDITEQKRLQRQLHQSQKMEAIATLAGGVAHEFNNALSAITGYTGLLETEFPDNGKIMGYTKPMKGSARRMARLTSQLLAYARGGRYNPRPMSLSEFVEGTLPLIRHTLAPAIRVETDLPPDILNVEADRTQMQMVLAVGYNGERKRGYRGSGSYQDHHQKRGG